LQRPFEEQVGSRVQTDVIVKLVSVDRSARGAADACVADLGIALAPLHPSTSDAELASYLVTQVDSASLDEVIERLRRCPGVEGAYSKPKGEPPGRM
jgi:hypothetical protein